MKVAGQEVNGEKVTKIGGIVAVVVIFVVAYGFGQRARSKEQFNMSSRLELTRTRQQNCVKEIKMMQGDMKDREQSEIQMAQDEHQALLTENQLLTEDNQLLREETFALEERIDEMREELNGKDWVSDEEVEALQQVMELGNNTNQLNEVLVEADVIGGINKDHLLQQLLDEVMEKRLAARGCRQDLISTVEELNKVTGQDHSKVVTDIFGMQFAVKDTPKGGAGGAGGATAGTTA